MEVKVNNQNESEQVRKTKNKIKKAFLELYETKGIEKISIKEITDLAGVNRGTFYVYYMDIYDLLEKVETEAFELLKGKAITIAKALLLNDNFEAVLPSKDFFLENKDYLDLFFGKNANQTLTKKIKANVKGFAREMIVQKGAYESEVKEEAWGIENHIKQMEIQGYVLEYLASAQLGLITYWYQNNMELPIAELGALIKQVNYNGPFSLLC